MIDVELLLDELEDLGHELDLVELVEAGEKTEDQLGQTIDKAVVEGVVVQAALSRSCAQGKLNALFDHDIAESEEEFLVFVDAKLTQLFEVFVHSFFSRSVIDL